MKIIIIGNTPTAQHIFDFLQTTDYKQVSILEDPVSNIVPNCLSFTNKGSLRIFYRPIKLQHPLENAPDLYCDANIVIETSESWDLMHLGLHGSLALGELQAINLGHITHVKKLQNDGIDLIQFQEKKRLFFLERKNATSFIESIDMLDGHQGIFVTHFNEADDFQTICVDHIVHDTTKLIGYSPLTTYLPMPHENYIDARMEQYQNCRQSFLQDLLDRLQTIKFSQYHSLLLFVLFFIQCTPSIRTNSKEIATPRFQNVDESLHQNTPTITRFFMPEFPTWLNFSEAAQCQRSNVVPYLNFSQLKAELDLDYEQSIRLQGQYFYDLHNNPQVDITALFYSSVEKVKGNIDRFHWPQDTTTVLVVALDSSRESKYKEQLQKLLKEHPFAKIVYISPCFHEIQEKVDFIGMEYFSPFHPNLTMKAEFGLYLSEIIPKIKGIKQKVIFVGASEYLRVLHF